MKRFDRKEKIRLDVRQTAKYYVQYTQTYRV